MNLLNLPELTEVQPAIILTGFLGAGKTTLMRHLLTISQSVDLKSDVILNDYADANVDSTTLQDLAKNIEPLTATCACCEGLEFLIELSEKSNASDADLLFIELNGTADPVPIVETFTLLESRIKLHPRWCICVIDVRHFGNRGDYSDIEMTQLQTASHVYLSHTGSESVPPLLLETIQQVNPNVSILNKQELAAAVVKLAGRKQRLLEETKASGFDLKLAPKSPVHQQTHEFNAIQLALPIEAEEDKIRQWLADIPLSVIRAKALIGVTGKPDRRYLFERVDKEVSPYTTKVALNKNVPNSVILIGPDLDPKLLEQHLTQHLYS